MTQQEAPAEHPFIKDSVRITGVKHGLSKSMTTTGSSFALANQTGADSLPRD